MAADQEDARIERLEDEVTALATLALRLVEACPPPKQPLYGIARLRAVVEDLEAKNRPRPALRVVEKEPS